MTANPMRRQNSSTSGGSGAAPTTKAQNFRPNAEWTRRYRHHRPGIEIPEGGGSFDSGHARVACSRRTSRIFGTHTSTETRRDLMSRRMSCGLKLRVKITVPYTIGGTLVAIDWPNMWLSGSRLRNRRGWNGRAYLRY